MTFYRNKDSYAVSLRFFWKATWSLKWRWCFASPFRWKDMRQECARKWVPFASAFWIYKQRWHHVDSLASTYSRETRVWTIHLNDYLPLVTAEAAYQFPEAMADWFYENQRVIYDGQSDLEGYMAPYSRSCRLRGDRFIKGQELRYNITVYIIDGRNRNSHWHPIYPAKLDSLSK